MLVSHAVESGASDAAMTKLTNIQDSDETNPMVCGINIH